MHQWSVPYVDPCQVDGEHVGVATDEHLDRRRILVECVETLGEGEVGGALAAGPNRISGASIRTGVAIRSATSRKAGPSPASSSSGG